jgi:post-segregation antitoxin (ccd killing protein)
VRAGIGASSPATTEGKGLDLSVAREGARPEERELDRPRCWAEANKASIAAYNENVLNAGVFSDGRRTF